MVGPFDQIEISQAKELLDHTHCDGSLIVLFAANKMSNIWADVKSKCAAVVLNPLSNLLVCAQGPKIPCDSNGKFLHRALHRWSKGRLCKVWIEQEVR